MKRLQGYRFEMTPTGEQARQMRRFSGSCRFVWNRALEIQKSRYESGEPRLRLAALCREITGWRHAEPTAWLADAPIHPLQQTVRDLDRAYGNLFSKRALPPRFRKKGVGESFRYPDPKQFTLDQGNSRVRLPKLGWLRFRKSREIEGTVKNVTISLSCGKWYVSFQTEREVPEPVHPSTSSVGIDVGVRRFATLSDGTEIEPLDSFARTEKKLARAQRALARKTKFSMNWRKQKARVGRIHRKVAAVRNDFLHKLSSDVSKNHALAVVEALEVKRMTASARGTVESPGTGVARKRVLNRRILDQGWGTFRRMLGYKLAWRGGRLVEVNPAYTSRTCSACGSEKEENRRGAKFRCVVCGHEADADLNAALNILAAGLAVSACGAEGTAPASKQEPAEATSHG